MTIKNTQDIPDIDSVLKTGTYHVFYKYKPIKQLTTPIPKKLNEHVKKYISPPKTNKKVFVVRIKLIPDEPENILIINCLQQTIKTNLSMITEKRDYKITVEYSKEELDKYGFKLSYIKKIIKALENNTFGLDKKIISITQILN